jgi:hypothetical protein
MKARLEFDVALSFAGEDRKYVERTAMRLRGMGLRIFYDKYESVSLWGKNLYDHLTTIYSDRARFVVLFVSKYYSAKLWTNHERKSAQERAFRERKEYILPVRFDSTRLPGLAGTVGYIDLDNVSPEALAEMIKREVGQIERPAFWPEHPDKLYRKLRAKEPEMRDKVDEVAVSLFDALKLMTAAERRLLYLATRFGCVTHLPRCSHVEIRYLARVAGRTPDQIQSTFARLDCLGIASKLSKDDPHDGVQLGAPGQWLEVGFRPRLSRRKYGMDVVTAVVDVIDERLCRNCAPRAFGIMDFSILSRRTGLQESHSAGPQPKPTKKQPTTQRPRRAERLSSLVHSAQQPISTPSAAT